MSAVGPMPIWRRVLTERRTVVLPLMAAFVLNIGALVLGVLPLRQAVKSAEESSVSARLSLASAKLADKTAKDARAGKDRADSEMKKFYSEILPRSYQEAVTITRFWLEKTARDSRVSLRSGTYSEKALQDSTLVRVTGKATLVGEYADIRRFLYEVETAEQFVVIESLELSTAGTVQSGNLLEVSLDIATYFVDERAVAAGKSGAQ
jgi:hypothetical protein